ncbi:MAG TPA: tetratricopeptide repeat protein [Spirochaetota bacterium]|nr:tetratricopeptide repeat protein [Spirochaetota bacterium]HOS39316.1 tetratricopeptide repeat protein [Spirochaetota bacterium]HPU89262.1 tetratricopeptide repeat protein [Spirochaetota bacterium]
MKRTLIALIACMCAAANLSAGAKLKKMNVLVYPFANTGDAAFAWISAGMTDTVIADLKTLSGMNVFSEEDRKLAVHEMELAMAGLIPEKQAVSVGKIMGAHMIFTGSYTVAGGAIRIIAKLQNVETTRVEKTLKIDGSLSDIFRVQDQVVLQLLDETKRVVLPGVATVEVRPGEQQAITQKPAINVSAYEWYSKGLAVHDVNRDQALDFYSKAVALQPDYSAALNRIGMTYTAKKDIGAALDALARAEQSLVKGNRQNSVLFANVLNSFGMAYFSKKEYDRSLAFFNRSREVMEGLGKKQSRDYAVLMNNIAAVHFGTRDIPRTISYLDAALAILDAIGSRDTPQYARFSHNLGVMQASRKEYARALRSYAAAREIAERNGFTNRVWYGKILQSQAIALIKTGKSCDAVSPARASLAIFERAKDADASKARATLNAATKACAKK